MKDNNLDYNLSELIFGIEGDKFKVKKTGVTKDNLTPEEIEAMNTDISDMLFTSVLNFKKIFDDAKIGKSLNYALKGEEMRILFNTSGSN